MFSNEPPPANPFDDPEPAAATGPSRESDPTLKKGQRVTGADLPYIGVTVEDPNPPGRPQEALLRVPGLPADSFVYYPKSALRALPPDPSAGKYPKEYYPPISLLGCPCCPCWSPTLYFQPKKAVARLFCTLTCWSFVYIFCAILLLSAMGEVCALKYEVVIKDRPKFSAASYDVKQTFAQSAMERANDYHADYQTEARADHATNDKKEYTTTEEITPSDPRYAALLKQHPQGGVVNSGSRSLSAPIPDPDRFIREVTADRSLSDNGGDDAVADTAQGYAKQEATGYAKAEGNYKKVDEATAEYKDEYQPAEKDYKAEEYHASAYVDIDAYSKAEVGPACNRLVVFLASWTIIMIIITLLYGCCMLRHWRHFASTIGFWLAMLCFMAFDLLSVGVVFAIDAHNIHHQNHALYHRDPQWCERHPKAGGCEEYLLAPKAGHRQLKASENFLSWAFEIEIVCSILAFTLSYMYFVMALNTWRFSADLINDAARGRMAFVEDKLSRLAGETSTDNRLRQQKSLYYSKEFEHDMQNLQKRGQQ